MDKYIRRKRPVVQNSYIIAVPLLRTVGRQHAIDKHVCTTKAHIHYEKIMAFIKKKKHWRDRVRQDMLSHLDLLLTNFISYFHLTSQKNMTGCETPMVPNFHYLWIMSLN